jgi:hypothetical protein
MEADMASSHITRHDLIELLVWNDRDGVYRDADCDDEDLPRLTIGDAWALVISQDLHTITEDEFSDFRYGVPRTIKDIIRRLR